MNKKRMCKHCKTYGNAVSMFKCISGWFCDVDAAVVWSREKAHLSHEKSIKKDRTQQKREFYTNDVKTRKAAAKKACHDYIRYRDRNNSCICCDRQLGKNYDAGHFLESGNNSLLRYHEDNIHAQSVHCNQYKGGDSGNYEINLRAKIGDKRVEYLLANKGGVVKRTAGDYKDIEDKYKAKLKDLKISHERRNV